MVIKSMMFRDDDEKIITLFQTHAIIDLCSTIHLQSFTQCTETSLLFLLLKQTLNNYDVHSIKR